MNKSNTSMNPMTEPIKFPLATRLTEKTSFTSEYYYSERKERESHQGTLHISSM